MSRKCSSCGSVTKESPFCANCGAMFPVENEREVMRQTMGASFDLKWVLLGTAVVLALQFALVGALWSMMGKKILIGEKGRSLLEVNIESLSQDWGPNTGGTELSIRIVPDRKKENTSRSLIGVYLGGVKAKRFHIQKLAQFKKTCQTNCNKVTVAQTKLNDRSRACNKLDKTKTKVEACTKKCAALDADAKLKEKPEKLAEKKKRFKCTECATEKESYDGKAQQCESDLKKLKKALKTENARCASCQKDIPKYESKASACRKKLTHCWSSPVKLGRAPKPDLSKIKSSKEREAKLTAWRKDNKRRGELEFAQLHHRVNIFTPRIPNKTGFVNLKLVFSSGEEVTKRQAFYVANPSVKQRPKMKRTKHKPHDPVNTAGFWMVLLGSCLFYLLSGIIVGRLSPGVSIREPFTFALFGWIIFMAFLVVIGAAGSAVIFSAFAGAPAFIGSAMIGGIVAEKMVSVA